MIILRQKSFANAAKIISDDAIRKGVAKQVRISSEWIQKHPMDPGLLRKKTVRRVSIFSESEPEQKEFNNKTAKVLNKEYKRLLKEGKIKKPVAKNVDYSIEDKQIQLNPFNRSSLNEDLRKSGKKYHLKEYDHDTRNSNNNYSKSIMKYWRD